MSKPALAHDLAFLYKFRSAFWTADTDLSFSLWDPDLLSALRAGIDVKIFSLLLYVLLSSEKASYLIFNLQVFLIFRISFTDISGEHPEIDQYQQQKLPGCEKNAEVSGPDKQIDHCADQKHNDHKDIQSVTSVASIHKSCKLLF